jgi:hypothetical protein
MKTFLLGFLIALSILTVVFAGTITIGPGGGSITAGSGSGSIIVTSINPGDALLLESGDYLLLESGDKLLLEIWP